jgi:hypothetical protein
LEVLEFSIFFLSFWGSLIFLCEVSPRGGIFAILLVNFEGFLFWYFEAEFSFIFSCHFWGILNFLCEVSQGGKTSIFLSSYEL